MNRYKNIDWKRMRQMMALGLLSAAISMIGDLLLGWGRYGEGLSGVDTFFSLYRGVPDGRMIASAFIGMFGICGEMLCLSAIGRLIGDNSTKLARAYRTGILGCSVFGICGFHVGCVAMFFAYKRIYELAGVADAQSFVLQYALYFVAPAFVLFLIFFLMFTFAQIKAFACGRTPYPKWCWVFSVLPVACVVQIICGISGNHPLANAVDTAWFHVGAAWMFSGLLFSAKYAAKK